MMRKSIFLISCLLWMGFLNSVWAASLHGRNSGYFLNFLSSHEYTDNLYLTDKNEKDDFVSLFGLSFVADKQFQVSYLNLDYSLSRSFYWQHSGNNAFRHSLKLDYLRALTKKLSLDFKSNFYRTEEPIEKNEEVFREHKYKRETYYRYLGSLSVSYQFNPGFALSVGTSLNYLQNKNPSSEDSRIYSQFIRIKKEYIRYFAIGGLHFSQREFEDTPQTNTWGIDASLGYKIARDKDVSLNFTIDRTQEMGPYSEDYWAYKGDIQFGYSPTPDQRYWVSVGYYYRDQDNSSDDDNGLTYSVNYAKEYQHTRIVLSGSGGYRYEYGEAENNGFTEYYLAGLRVIHEFSRTLMSEAGISYRYEDFKDEDRTDKTQELYLMLKKMFSKKAYVSLTYNYRHNNSDKDLESYTENLIQVFFIYNFWHGQSI